MSEKEKKPPFDPESPLGKYIGELEKDRVHALEAMERAFLAGRGKTSWKQFLEDEEFIKKHRS